MDQHKGNGISPSPSEKPRGDIDGKEDSSSGGFYGWFTFNPTCLQIINNATFFTAIITLVNIFQSGTTNGLMGAVQSSLEKRFELTSTQSSWIIITYEIATIPLAIFVMYVGTVGCHKPRWTCAFLFISTVGCFLYALPHFTTGVYLPEGEGEGSEGPENLCRNRTGEALICDETEESSNLQYYIFVFILGRIGLSFGGSGLYNFAVIYVDDSVTRDKFSLYTSMLALGGVVGPALGFIVGGLSLSIYTDFASVDDEDLDFEQDDPRWVGAWWLGYIIAGFGIIISTLPITGYPRDLPGAEDVRLQKKNEAYGTKTDDTVNKLKIDFGLKDVPRYLKDLFTNWSFIFLTLFVCCDMAIISGFTVFGPKYVEVQFSLTAATAAILFGVLVVPAGVVGATAGGLIVERLKLSFERIVLIQFLVSVVVTCTAFMFMIYCEQIEFVGVNVGYNGSSVINMTDACNSQCMCDDVPFSPVCSHEYIQYFSACHAGCIDYTETDSIDFYNCSCIPEVNLIPQASLGICESSSCQTRLAAFSVFIFLAMVGLFMCEAMNISSVIRVVPNSHRLFAMMCEGFVIRFLGTMPGPVIFGAAFDGACLLWYTPCSNEGGSCFHYDNNQLGYYMLVIAGSLKLASCLCMFLAWKLYKAPQEDDSIVKELELDDAEEARAIDAIRQKDVLDIDKNDIENNELEYKSNLSTTVMNGDISGQLSTQL